MRSVDEYLALVPSWNASDPNFMAELSAVLSPFADLQTFFAGLPQAFDLDKAIGAQLDAVGQWVNRSRVVSIPLQGLYFSFGDPIRGWGVGVWKGPYDSPVGISRLDDDTYRLLLRADILSNNWNGSVEGAQAIVDEFFSTSTTLAFIDDRGFSGFPNTFFTWGSPSAGWGEGAWKRPSDTIESLPEVDMAMTLGIAGPVPSIIILSLLGLGYLRIKPVGVALDYKVTSINGAPLFGFGVQNEYISGWGSGAWGIAPLDAIYDLAALGQSKPEILIDSANVTIDATYVTID